MNWSLDWEHQKGCKRKEKMPLIKKPWWVIRRIFLGAKKNWLSPWGEEKIDNVVWRKSPCRWNEIDSCREAKKNWLSPWGKEKSISPWGVNRRQAEWNQFLPWGKEKLIIAVRRRENRYHREAWIAVWAEWNWFLPWGEEKLIITVRHETPSGRMKSILAVRQRNIDYRREAKRKLITLWWGANRRKAEWNQFLPWGKEKIDYRREAKRKLISPWGVNRHKAEWNWFLPWGKEKLIIAVRRRENW